MLNDENARLNSRLHRLSALDESRARQLIIENVWGCTCLPYSTMKCRTFKEINLIEIARLQQSLLHSVPLSEYNHLLSEHKYLLAKQTMGVDGPSVVSYS